MTATTDANALINAVSGLTEAFHSYDGTPAAQASVGSAGTAVAAAMAQIATDYPAVAGVFGLAAATASWNVALNNYLNTSADSTSDVQKAALYGFLSSSVGLMAGYTAAAGLIDLPMAPELESVAAGLYAVSTAASFAQVYYELESAEFSATFWRLVMCAHSRRARVR
jgi:hypothetical protein